MKHLLLGDVVEVDQPRSYGEQGKDTPQRSPSPLAPSVIPTQGATRLADASDQTHLIHIPPPPPQRKPLSLFTLHILYLLVLVQVLGSGVWTQLSQGKWLGKTIRPPRQDHQARNKFRKGKQLLLRQYHQPPR